MKIKDVNIKDEILAAYIDGNLSESEMENLEKSMDVDTLETLRVAMNAADEIDKKGVFGKHVDFPKFEDDGKGSIKEYLDSLHNDDMLETGFLGSECGANQDTDDEDPPKK